MNNKHLTVPETASSQNVLKGIVMETQLNERVAKLCAGQFLRHDADASEVKPEMTLEGDLCMDSLDLVELVMGLEEEFDLTISDEDAEQWKTVEDIQVYIRNTEAK